MILGSLDFLENDFNLTSFGGQETANYITEFYLNTLPSGKDEFLSKISSLVVSSDSDEIDFYGTKIDRKSAWDNLLNYYKNAFYPKITPLKEVLESNDWLNELLAFFQDKNPLALEEEFVALIQCSDGREGKPQIMFFTTKSIHIVYEKSKDRRYSSVETYTRSEIAEVSVGVDVHESYGVVVLTTIYWVFAIYTTGHQSYTKYVYMGRNDKDLNQSRPSLVAKIEKIGHYYPLVQGDSVESASGLRVTPSIGFWRPLD